MEATSKRDTFDGVPAMVNSTTPAAVRSPPINTNTTNTNTNTIAKMVSRNANGTLVMTSAPSNEAELQLYRVMQRASLLAYYDTLLEMGGDDVQQLCDAGEEEFLEIMALVRMASKPLHVRRLQKALQEWVSNPALFQVPLVSPPPSGAAVTFPPQMGVMRSSLSPQHPPLSRGSPGVASIVKPTTVTETSVAIIMRNPVSPVASQVPVMDSTNNVNHQHYSSATSSPGNNSNNGPTPSRAGPSTSPGPGSPLQQLQLTPVLLEAQINRLADAADLLVRSLPAQFEPRPHSAKKKVCKELELVMSMSEDDPRRMDEIRKYAAIYGRFDCKRKPEKPLTLHEVSVNEAAAQICRIVPALLARRDELFPLARQVVRDSGYHYSKPQNNVGYYRSCGARSNGNGGLGGNGADEPPSKRIRLESAASSLSPSSSHGADLDHDSRDHRRRQDRCDQVGDELRALAERGEELALAAQQLRDAHDFAALHSLQQQMEALHSRQAQLLAEQADLQTRHLQPRYCRRGGGGGRDSERPDTDDTDSQFSFSNASSPSQEVGDSRDSSRGDLDVACEKTTTTTTTSRCKISKQMLQEALVDEGLRVVKEMVANQQLAQTRSTLEPHEGEEPFPEARVQVIASGDRGNIIAVANPALSMSPALQIKTEPNALAAESAE